MNTTVWCVRVLVAVIALAGAVAAAMDITVTPIARDGQVVVSFDLSDGFTLEVRDAIQSGLSTTFSYDVDLRRGATLFDRTVASVTMSATVRTPGRTTRGFSGRGAARSSARRSSRLFNSGKGAAPLFGNHRDEKGYGPFSG